MALELERARRVAKLPVSSGELSQGERQRTSRFVSRLTATHGVAADANACDAHGLHAR